MNTITMRRLGNHGRFGNAIFQSAFLAFYAQRHGLTVQAPMFPGQEIFPFRFEPVHAALPEAEERRQPPGGPQMPSIPPCGDEFVNRDWVGYGQFHTSWYSPFRGRFYAMFEPIQLNLCNDIEHRVSTLLTTPPSRNQ